MKPFHPDVRRDRATWASVVLLVVMGILVAAFFRAQVVRGSAWALQSDSNRLRVVRIPAPRGTIFDRYGRVIAENVPSYNVSLFPAHLDSMRASLARLGPVLGLTDERIEELGALAAADRRQPLVVLRNASYEAVAALEERRAEFPGVSVEMEPKRHYQGGAAMGHILGYVGEISRDELEMPFFEGYERGMVVGKDGLERQYERTLQGTHGVRYVEVDASGRLIGAFEGQPATPAVPGEDLHLHIDLALMEFIHRIFPADHQGAVVMLDAEDGGIIALYSAPSFDPNAFVGGIDPTLWNELQRDPRRPLFNRAVVGTYQPASTFKLAVAAIALEDGLLQPGEVMPVPCTGSFTFQGLTSRCWHAGHGYLDLAGALAQSCNVYFYQVGIRIGLDRLTEAGAALGFGQRCGIDLPAEARGTFPSSRAYWMENFGYRPFENEVMALSIGGGPNDQTPLRMAQFYLALGTNGEAPPPRLARSAAGEVPPAGEGWTLDLSRENLDALLEGLRQVTSAAGTAAASRLQYWDLIGKTGTVGREIEGALPHAWFIGLAGPWGEPAEVVVAVIVEEGESGSGMAAPIAAKAVDFHLRSRHGIPISEVQTYREHIQTGTPAPWINRDPYLLRNPPTTAGTP